MTELTVLDIDESTVSGSIGADGVLIDRAGLTQAIGWELKPEGLCRDDICVPVDPDSLLRGDRIDLTAVAERLGQSLVADESLAAVALSSPAADRNGVQVGTVAPDATLLDDSGAPVRLSGFRGRKTLLVAFASW